MLVESRSGLRCPRCGEASLRFQPNYPLLTAIDMVFGCVGPSEREPDGSGSWVCSNVDCRSALSSPAVTPTAQRLLVRETSLALLPPPRPVGGDAPRAHS
jgi:hypothetical protein